MPHPAVSSSPSSPLDCDSCRSPGFQITLQNLTRLERQGVSSLADFTGDDDREAPDCVPLTPLDADSVSALLSRLAETQDEDVHDCDDDGSELRALRRDAAVAPPHKPGMLLPVPFPPPPEERPEQPLDLSSLPKISADQSELEVLPPLSIAHVTPPSYAVDYTLSSISLTFSQPMVPLSSISQVEADTAALAFSLSPHVDGAWRWLGTQTLQFNAKHRFPFATQFCLSVSEDCKSAVGGTLRSPFVHTFCTLPPRVVDCSPSGKAVSLSPLFLLCFNQRISPTSILSHVHLARDVDGAKLSGQDFESVDEPLAKEKWPDMIGDEREGMWVAFKLRGKVLERATSYSLCVPARCPSAEGNLESEEDWSGRFSTFGPLVVVSSRESSYGSTEWHIEFSNELDHTSVSKSAVRVSPSIPDFKVSHMEGNSFIILKPTIQDVTATYVVTLDASIKDVYGQHLYESKVTAEFHHTCGAFLQGPSGMVVLDPSAISQPFISVSVRSFSSLHIQVFQVQVNDYRAFMERRPSAAENNCTESPALGKKVSDQDVDLPVVYDELCEHSISLGSFLQHPDEHYGQLLVIAEPTKRSWIQLKGTSSSYDTRNVVRVWIQCTALTVDVYPDPVNGFCTAWVSSLETGAPISEAIVRLGSHAEETGDDGLVVLKTGQFNDIEGSGPQKHGTISVQKGNDLTFLPNIRIDNVDMETDAWYVFDSRGLYKPTEIVHVKGYLRILKRKSGGCRQPVLTRGHVSYVVNDARRNKLAEGDVSLTQYGSFFFSFYIPDNANLGAASVQLRYAEEGEAVQHRQHVHVLKIQEFRTPEFEVKTTHHGVSALYSHVSSASFVIVSTAAEYYAGGPVEGSNVSWIVEPSQTNYTPPGHTGYTFGANKNGFFCGQWGRKKHSTFLYASCELRGKLGMDGKHYVKIEFKGIEERPSSISVSASAHVTDINNQVQSGSTSFVVHPCPFFVGYKLTELFGRQGEEVRGEVIVSDVDGKLIEGMQVKVKVTGQGKKEEDDDAGLSVYRDVLDEQEFAVLSGKAPVEFSFVPSLGGSYSIIFKVADSENRFNESSFDGFFVSGACMSSVSLASSAFVREEKAQIIPNKGLYEPGEKAALLIQSPFWPAEGLLIMKQGRQQVGQVIRFHMPESTHTLTSFLESCWIPSVEVSLLLVRYTGSNKDAMDQTQVIRPAFATAKTSLKISWSSQSFSIQIIPKRDDEIATPGGAVHVLVKVRKESSREVGSDTEISLVVVDEAIVNLAGYSLSDPMSVFYPAQRDRAVSYHLRNNCVQPDYHVKMYSSRLGARAQLMAFRMGYARGANSVQARIRSNFDPRSAVHTIRTRCNFDPLAAFVPHCVTDRHGCVEVKVHLPDNLTRYRIWAVAATETQFGLAEASLTVQLPLILRPSPPRFLNLLDKAFISVVLQNQANISLPVIVGMRKRNGKLEAETLGYSLTLPSSRRVVVAFPVLAVHVGNARLQVVVSTTDEHDAPCFFDASEIIIPIFTPAVSEHLATYGDMAEEEVAVQPIKSPMDAFPGYGGLYVAISSTTLQSLTDALLYLYSYPFECNEQLASRMIGFVGLWEVLEAFKVKEMPSKDQMKIKLMQDLRRLKDRQLDSGGWSWWTSEGTSKSQPFISLHVACALIRASKIVEVDNEMLEKALGYCSNIRMHLSEGGVMGTCREQTKHSLLAYAVYILALSNKDVGEEASDLLLTRASVAELSLEACGWILIALGSSQKNRSNEIRVLLDHVKSRILETGEYAHFTTSYQDDGQSVMLHSNARTSSILLEALLVTEPSSPLCAKLAKGLQAHRTAGRWNSTQENCFAVMALNRFFTVYEEAEPNFTANVWLGEEYVTSQNYSGRTLETKQAKLSMPFLLSELASKESLPLVLQKKGKGRLYFRIGLEYAPKDFRQDAASHGFVVKRVYEGLDSSLTVLHDQTLKTWNMKAGEKVRVRLTIATIATRYHVALVDYVPAGCEPINPSLARVGATGRNSCTDVCSWRSRWAEHVNIRNERVEAFRTVLRPGQYEYCYIMRVTCRGEFVIPPAKAEEMYNPETFGRCSSEKCVIS